ncbi:MAG TPA: glycosyltransferase family 2 protein [Pirellulaceae bacterium]|jgi:glycosyltransferase involved in cell wall biosynthesis
MPTTSAEFDAEIGNCRAVCPPRDDEALARVDVSLSKLEQLAADLAAENHRPPAMPELALPANFKLSVVIPVYNEQATIRQVIDNVAVLPVAKEIIVVDDASTDRTRQVLAECEKAAEISVIYKPQNEGKGAALRTGFRRVTGDVVVVQDADLEYDPQDILGVIRPIALGHADVVYGSRFLNQESAHCRGVHRFGNACLTRLSNWFTGLAITDMETCYKAFRREVLNSFEIRQPRFGFEPEVTARIARRNYRLAEVPIRYSPRGYAEGKKIGVKDLISTLLCIVRYGLAD